MSRSLAFDTSFVDAVAAKLSGELADTVALANDPACALEDRVHRARVATKELRAFLRMARPSLRHYRVLDEELSVISRRLARCRDSYVRTQLLAELFETAPRQAGLADFADRMEDLAGPPPDATDQQTQLDAFSRDIAALADNATLWQVEPRGWSCLADGAALTYRTARLNMLDAAASGIAADFYEWRKQVTYHALQLALLSPLAHGPSERRCKVMAQLAELLGRHHDFEALDLYLESKAPLPPEGLKRFRAVIKPLKAGLERTALRVGKEKLRHKPDKIRNSIAKALKRRRDMKVAV